MPQFRSFNSLPLQVSDIVQAPNAPVAIVQAPPHTNLGTLVSAPVVPISPPPELTIGPLMQIPVVGPPIVVNPRLESDLPQIIALPLAPAPSLNLINELTLVRAKHIRPELFDDFWARRWIPRSRLSVPICTNADVQTQPNLLWSTLLQEPADPQALSFLPRYKLATEDVVGGQQLRVRLENTAQGGRLAIHVLSYPDPAIEQAARSARQIDAPVMVELRYERSINGQATWDHWAFQEIAGEAGGFCATLYVDTLELPQLHVALLASGTTLVVRRSITYALGVASQTVPPYEDLFALHTSAVEDTLPCSFPASYSYIFQDGPQAQGQSMALVPHTLQWQGRQQTYYQDPARPWRFFYLPDAFKIARQPAAPRAPAITLATRDGQLTMSYAAAPYTDAKRLADAAQQLSGRIPAATHLPEGVRGPQFELLATAKASFRVALARAGGTAGPLVERPNVGLDFNNPAKGLPGGIYDSVTMPLDDFLPIFDALCSDRSHDAANTLFLGEVDLALGDTPLPPIPFVARLNDLVGELLSYAEEDLPNTSYPSLEGVRAVFTNVIESPLLINRLGATLRRSGGLAAEATALIRDESLASPSFPITLAPGAQLKLLVTPASPLPGSGPLDAVFDLDGLAALPDRALALDAMMDKNVPATRALPVDVKLPRAVFGKDSDPGGALYAVSVRFPGRGPAGEDIDIDLTADMPDGPSGSTSSAIITKTATLYLPARGFLLRQGATWEYQYSVTLRRTQGEVAGESGTRTGTSFWPKVS